MTAVQVVMCLMVAASIAGGQVLFKLASVAWNRADGAGDPLAFLLSAPLIGALATYGISAFAWIFVLRSVPLSRAYVFILMGAAVVPLLAWGVFKEPLTPRYLMGFVLILVGLYTCLGGKAAA